MITVRQLLSLPVFQGSEICAGVRGIEHPVRCIDIAEVPDPSAWLDPGVFILTTAYAFHKEKKSLMFFIESLVKNRAAGLGIKLGRFLDELPHEFLDYAEKFNLPVILLPLQLRYTHAIRSVTEAILNDERSSFLSSDLNESFAQILFGDSIDEALEAFEKAGFCRSSNAVVLLIDGASSESSVLTAIMAGVAENHGDLFAIVKTSCETIMLARPFILEEYDFSRAIHFFPEGAFAALGGEYSLEEIRRSYEEARLSKHLLRLFNLSKGVYSKIEMELFFPFVQGDSGKRALQSSLCLLNPIIEYDLLNRSSLLETLWVFLLCDCDHARTAQRLHLHRNSLRYRLAKIRRLLPEGNLKGVGLHRLFLALMIYFSRCAPCTK